MSAVDQWLPTMVAIAALAAVAATGLAVFRVPHARSVLIAIVRAAVQLAALSLVLSGILHDPVWVGVALSVMFVAAVATAAQRARASHTALFSIAFAMAAGPLLALLVVFVTGAIEFSPRYVLAIGGIVIGNTMTIAILTQRIFRRNVADRWPEVEAWLALGATPRRATLALARDAVGTALLPSIDQTRTTGIVVLPGAFVGAIFAGASPLEAGRFQLVVLASILAAGVVTATLLARLIGSVGSRPD